MSSKERLRKPTLDRTEPVRNWSTVFGAPNSNPNTDAGSPKPAARSEQEGLLGDVVSRSVDVAYRVIDEYISRGQQVAQRISERSYDVRAMTSDVQDLTARTFEYASDLGSVWFDLLQRAASDSALLTPRTDAPASVGSASDTTASGAPAQPQTGPPPVATDQQSARVKIEIASAQPAEVTLDLRPEATHLQLIVHALRAVDPGKPRIADAGFRPGRDGEPPSLWLRVPAGQPPGVYNAVIVDEQTSRPVGTLSVRILPDMPEPR